MKRGSERWIRSATGGAGLYFCAAIVALVVMSMEPTPELLRNTSWILAIVGLFVFASIFARLRYFQDRQVRAAVRKGSHADQTRRHLAVVAWLNLAVFVICGLAWVFAARAQCLIQEWVLGLVVAEGCTQ